MLASPLPSARAGEPDSVVPDDGSSSLNVIPSFEANPVNAPVSVAGLEPPPKSARLRVAGASDRLAAPMITVPLSGLAGPCQLAPITGVIVYRQLPNGTPYSVQVS